MSDVIVPDPYQGLSIRQGDQVVNVHFVEGSTVYYGKYHELAIDCPYHCIGNYRQDKDEFVNAFARAVLDGAQAYSNIEKH